MLAALADDLPAGPGWLYEPKWDGFRCLAGVGADGRAWLNSRRGTALGDAFPEVAAAVAEALPANSVIDGEIVRWDDAHLDFEALQRRNRTSSSGAARLARSEPCNFIAFDLLIYDGVDLMQQSLADRRRRLEQVMVDAPVTIAIGMQTDDPHTARFWAEELADMGVEGIVAKKATEPYRPGARAWQKIKEYTTTEVILGGITGTLAAPESLIVGRFRTHDGRLHIAGRTAELTPAAARRIANVIRPAGEDHPWPAQLPPSWRDRDPRPYQRVVPEVVVEVRVDVAVSRAENRPSHWRHKMRFVRIREDIPAAEVPLDLTLSSIE